MHTIYVYIPVVQSIADVNGLMSCLSRQQQCLRLSACLVIAALLHAEQSYQPCRENDDIG